MKMVGVPGVPSVSVIDIASPCADTADCKDPRAAAMVAELSVTCAKVVKPSAVGLKAMMSLA